MRGILPKNEHKKNTSNERGAGIYSNLDVEVTV